MWILVIGRLSINDNEVAGGKNAFTEFHLQILIAGVLYRIRSCYPFCSTA